jgi:hypothetical protein
MIGAKVGREAAVSGSTLCPGERAVARLKDARTPRNPP